MEAIGHLEGFTSLFFTLEDDAQRKLLADARKLLGYLEKGERPMVPLDRSGYGGLDI